MSSSGWRGPERELRVSFAVAFAVYRNGAAGLATLKRPDKAMRRNRDTRRRNASLEPQCAARAPRSSPRTTAQARSLASDRLRGAVGRGVGEKRKTPPGEDHRRALCLKKWTRTQPIRTAALLPVSFAIVSPVPTFCYREIAPKALELRRLGMADSAIARSLGVSDKTVAKGIAFLLKLKSP